MGGIRDERMESEYHEIREALEQLPADKRDTLQLYLDCLWDDRQRLANWYAQEHNEKLALMRAINGATAQ